MASVAPAPPGRLLTVEAFERVLRVRLILSSAHELARDGKVRELEAVVPPRLIGELEEAAAILASSVALSREARTAIGWQWGACVWRQCGAQADAAQALWKLRANLGMSAPLEAVYYLDVAERAIDEILQLGARERFLPASSLPRFKYLSAEALAEVLALDDGDENGESSHKVLQRYPGATLDLDGSARRRRLCQT